MRRSPRSRSRRGLRCVLVALLLGAACSSGGGSAAPSPPPAAAADPLRDIARDEGTVGVIVDLAVEQNADGTWDEKAIAAAQRDLLKELGNGATVAARYKKTPQLALALNERALKKLRASALVVGVHLNETDEATE